MALKLYERYPQLWESPSNDYPQGAFKNLSAQGETDGSYLEKDWLNDYSGFFGALLRNAEMTPNGTIDTAQKSQFYDALIKVAKGAVADQGYATKTYVDNKFNEVPKTEIITDWDQASDENVFSAGFVKDEIERYREFQTFDGDNILDKIINASQQEYSVGFGDFEIEVSGDYISKILSNLRLCLGKLTIKVKGHITLNKRIEINCIGASNIKVVGESMQLSCTSSTLVSKNRTRHFLNSVAGISTSDILKLFPSDKTTMDTRYAGGWQILEVGEDYVDVRNTSKTDPTGTFSGNAHVIKSSLTIADDDCFYITHGDIFLDKLALIGGYDILTGEGGSGSHGIAINAPSLKGSSNAPVIQQGGVTTGVTVAILNFSEQGFATEGGNSSINFLSVTGCRKRGIYSTAGYVRCKFSMCVGNGEDGFIADFGGASLDASHSIASGNGLNGYWSTNSGFISGANSVAQGNLGCGYEARGLSRVGATNATALENGKHGFFANRSGSFVYANSTTSNNNGEYGFAVFGGGNIYSESNTSTGNTLGYYNNGETFRTRLRNSYHTNLGVIVNVGSAKVSSTSIGDLILNDTLLLKSDSHLRAVTTDQVSLGTSSSSFKDLYLLNAPIVTSDANAKFDIEDISDSYLKVISKLHFKQFKLKAGTSGRTHFGIIAQDWIKACEDCGVDPSESGVLVGSEEDGYAIRYGELQNLFNAYILHKLNS